MKLNEEPARQLRYDEPPLMRGIGKGVPSKQVLKLENGELVPTALLTNDLPETMEDCRELAAKYGLVVTCTPLRILDRMFASADRKLLSWLSTVGQSPDDDIRVRPLRRKGLTVVRFKNGGRYDYIVNLNDFASSLGEAWRFANDVFCWYGVGVEALITPASLMQHLLIKFDKGAFCGKMHPRVEELAHQCFKAGRFELIQPGTQEIDLYDTVGAYSSELADCQHFSPTYTEWLESPTIEEVKHDSVYYAFCRCQVKVGSSRISPLLMRLLMYNGSTRCVTPTEMTVELFLTKPEIMLLLRSGVASVNILSGVIGKVMLENKPMRYVFKEFHRLRTQYPRAFKLMGSVGPGKMDSVITVVDLKAKRLKRLPSAIFNPVYAAHSAGAVRARVTEWALRYPDKVVRIASDGIVLKAGTSVQVEKLTTTEEFGKVRRLSSLVGSFTDQFADKPGKEPIYADSYKDGCIVVGWKENYPSLITGPSLHLSEGSITVPCGSVKRIQTDRIDYTEETCGTLPTRGEEELKELLLRREVCFADD